MNLRKTLELKIGEHTVEVPVDFHAIEITETVFNATADHVLSGILTDPRFIKRTQVARVISQWAQLPKGVKRQDLYEQALVADSDTLNSYVGAIQGAIAYSLKYINEKDLDILARGEDLDADPLDQTEEPQESPEEPSLKTAIK